MFIYLFILVTQQIASILMEFDKVLRERCTKTENRPYSLILADYTVSAQVYVPLLPPNQV